MLQPDNAPKHYLSYHNVDWAVTSLQKAAIGGAWKIRKVVGVARGGLIPAVMIAHRLNVTDVGLISAKSYDEQDQQKELVLELAGIETETLDDPSVLVVDDLWDTGETMMAIRNKLPRAILATTFYKPNHCQNIEALDYPGESLPPNWIVFPWEREHGSLF